MKYKTYIFDFDFTLADATIGIVESVNYALIQVGLNTRSRDAIRKTVGMTLKDIFFELTTISDEHTANLFVSHFKFMADKVMADNTILFDDTINVLSQLKRHGYNTAIVTTKFRYRIEEVLNIHHISALIDFIVGYEDVDIPKPSPQGLLKAIEHFDNDKQTVLFIGDSLIDANTAKNASVDFAAVLTGTTSKEEFSKFPHIYIAKNLSELIIHKIRSNP